MNLQKDNRLEIFILILMSCIISCASYVFFLNNSLSFSDTDDFMRIIRLDEFFKTGDFYNSVIDRANYPYGCDLHWTRFYDLFLSIPILIIHWLGISIEDSIKYVCFVISPIIKLICTILVFDLLKKFMSKESSFVGAAVFCGTPFVSTIFSFGRPDHHAFIMMWMIIYASSLVDILQADKGKIKPFLKSGTVAAINVWISPETLIPILLGECVLFLRSFNDEELCEKLYFKNATTAFFIMVITGIEQKVFSTPSYGLTVCFWIFLFAHAMKSKLTFQSPYLRYWHFAYLLNLMMVMPFIGPVEYDKISIVHFVVFACITVGMAINIQLMGQKYHKIDIIIWCAVIATVFLSIYPLFLKGMAADVPELAKRIWLYKVNEMRSPFAKDTGLFMIVFFIICLVAIVVKIQELSKNKIFQRTEENTIWWLFTALGSAYTILGCCAYRMLPYAALFSTPLIISLGMDSFWVKKWNHLSKIVFTLCLGVFFVCFTGYCEFDPEEAKKNRKETYSPLELFNFLDKLSPTPKVIMAYANDGPTLLYYTKHTVISVPYHRATQGIIYSYIITQMSYDEKLAKKVLKKTRSQYIFLRKSVLDNPKSLGARIFKGEIPTWCKKIKVPEKFDDIVLVEIDQSKL